MNSDDDVRQETGSTYGMTDDLPDWIVCPWCSSDEPTGDPDPTNVSVSVYESESGDKRIAFRCHSCTLEGDFEL